MFVTKQKNCNENSVDFKKKTQAELRELLERQNKILCNRKFIDGLPDRGEKVKQFHNQIELELKKRYNADQLCKDMALLNINKDQLDTLEWTGKHIPCTRRNSGSNVDEDGNVLKMFISHSGVNPEKIIIREESEKPLIKMSNFIDNKQIHESQNNEFKDFQDNMERYAKNLCGRIDDQSQKKNKHLFLNKPVKQNKHNEIKVATLSLKESVVLQIKQENKLKEIQKEHLKERSFSKFNTKNYRNVKQIDFDDIVEDESDENDEN